MEKDSHILKLSGKAELPFPIEVSNNYEIKSIGSITAYTKTDNDDGSYNHIYTFKPVTVEILSDKGERLKLKDTRSNSQQLRSLLYKKWVNSASQITFEDFYDNFILGVMRHSDELIDRFND